MDFAPCQGFPISTETALPRGKAITPAISCFFCSLTAVLAVFGAGNGPAETHNLG
jgi:hypothetical protein